MSRRYEPMAILTDNVVRLSGLRFEDDDTPIDDATVSILDITEKKSGSSVTGLSFPIAFAAQGGQVYEALVSKDGDFVYGESYELKVQAVKSGYTKTWYQIVVARKASA